MQKILLYNLTTRLKPQAYHHLPLVVGYIMNGGIANDAQLTAAIDHVLHHSANEKLDARGFEESCGVGAVVTPDELEDGVRPPSVLYVS